MVRRRGWLQPRRPAGAGAWWDEGWGLLVRVLARRQDPETKRWSRAAILTSAATRTNGAIDGVPEQQDLAKAFRELVPGILVVLVVLQPQYRAATVSHWADAIGPFGLLSIFLVLGFYFESVCV